MTQTNKKQNKTKRRQRNKNRQFGGNDNVVKLRTLTIKCLKIILIHHDWGYKLAHREPPDVIAAHEAYKAKLDGLPPAEIISLCPSSMDISSISTFSLGNRIKKPEVGLGVVGINTAVMFLKMIPVSVLTVGKVSWVIKPIEKIPLLGYSIIATLLKDLELEVMAVTKDFMVE